MYIPSHNKVFDPITEHQLQYSPISNIVLSFLIFTTSKSFPVSSKLTLTKTGLSATYSILVWFLMMCQKWTAAKPPNVNPNKNPL